MNAEDEAALQRYIDSKFTADIQPLNDRVIGFIRGGWYAALRHRDRASSGNDEPPPPPPLMDGAFVDSLRPMTAAVAAYYDDHGHRL